MLKIFDSLANKKQPVNNSNQITMYVCGPTVYNHPHIGNLRPLITFDVLVRLLKILGKDVNYVHNITDVDDKIIMKAQKEKVTEKEISEKYFKEYVQISKELNANNFTSLPKVTDHIQGIIEYIQKIVEKGFAYIIDGSVYFRVSSVKNYGEISKRNLEELQGDLDLENSNLKEQKLDFALWKKTTVGVSWDSPWGKGRPGWHTECSYFINKYFSKNVDIHGGGIDLKFPHHENENAQNYAINGIGLSKIWMHTGHINMNNEKMSKSLGNVLNATDVIKKYGYKAVRWLMYQSSYTKPINLSKTSLSDAQKEINKILLVINQAMQFLAVHDKEIEKITDEEFLKILKNGFDLSNSVTYINKVVKELNISIRAKNIDDVSILSQKLFFCLNILGIWNCPAYTDDEKKIIQKVNQFTLEKKYIEADELRKKIKLFN